MHEWEVPWNRRINAFPVKIPWVIASIKKVLSPTDGVTERETSDVDHVWKCPITPLVHLFGDVRSRFRDH